jgi:surface polysaccharide O-acyltransferase-like enzyme
MTSLPAASSSNAAAKERVFYVDMIRCTAAFLVVVSHVFAPVVASLNDYSLGEWWFFNFLDSIIRPCVPLFLMISGKLLLGSTREEPYLHFVRRRYGRLILPFFVWSIIYAYLDSLMDTAPFDFGDAVLRFLQGPTEYHLWFMYLILTLYLVTPFLRRFMQAATAEEIRALLILWFAFLMVQFFFPTLVGAGPVVILVNYGGYFVLGPVLDKIRIRRVDWLMLITFFIVLFNAMATYLLTIRASGVLDEKFYSGYAPLVAVYGAFFFLILKNIHYDRFLSKHTWLSALTMRMSRESYNLYLIHPFFIWLLTKGVLGAALSEDTGPNSFVGVSATAAAVLFCSLGSAILFKKIPIASRLFVSSVRS